MNIAQVLLSDRIGGAETLANSLAEAWLHLGAESIIIYVDPDDAASKSRLRRFLTLRRRLARIDPDLVVSHSAIPNVYARLASGDRPVIAVLHSAGDDFANRRLRLAERLLKRRTAAVVAVSEPQAARYRARMGEGPRMAVIPNGLMVPERPERSMPPRLHKLVTVARVVEQKNPLLWMDVTRSAAVSELGLGFEWWGPLAASGRLADEVGRYPGPGRFMGPTDDPWSQLAEADAYFHPAAHEAHSVGILEAAAAGLPIVCSDTVSTTLPEYLPRLVFRSGDTDEACRALEDLAKHWPRHWMRAQQARAAVRQEYSIELCARSYLEIAERVTEVGTRRRVRSKRGAD